MPASLNGILQVAKSGLFTHQLAMEVTGHNIANASTDGYSRQRAELTAATPLRMPEGLLGTGVRVADITRARNELLDGVFRRESSLFHGFHARYDTLSGVEAVFTEPSEVGLGATLDAFWDAWSDLSNDPSILAAREVVVARGQALADQFQRMSGALDATTGVVADGLRDGVDEVNRLLNEVAELNRQIASAAGAGRSAPDLADRRDVLLDELATSVPIEVTPRDTGAVGVSIYGVGVVEGVVSEQLVLSSAGGVWTLSTSGGAPLVVDSGIVGGGMDVLNADLAAFRTQLDELARGIVERVNAIHVTGTSPLGATGVNFFDDLGDPTTVTAQSFALDAAVAADASAVAAGTPDGGGNYQAGANDVALALSNLRDATTGGVLDGSSINGAYRDLAASVGLATASARESAAGHDVLRTSSDERRQSVHGVATDEELIKVVQFQAGYSAAARLVTVVDEMYQALLAI